MKLVPIADKNDLAAYHESILNLGRTTTKATYQEVASRIKSAIAEFGISKSRVLITGSDARGENPIFLRSHSPADLILTVKTEDNPRVIDLNTLEAGLREQGFNIDETKGSNDPRLFFRGDSHAVYPTRVFDAVLADNFEPSPTERDILFKELKRYPTDVIKRFTKKVKHAEKSMVSGLSHIHGQDRREVDYENGVVHYAPKEMVNGVKTGSLRFVQYGLMRFLINRVRSDKACEIDLMLPSNIFARIDALKSARILPLSTSEAEDLKFAYGYLLYLHHMMQLSNIDSNEQCFEIDSHDMKDIKQMIEDLSTIVDKLGNN